MSEVYVKTEDLATTWENADGVADVANAFGLSTEEIMTRVKRIRKAGVSLSRKADEPKPKPRGKEKLDVGTLNARLEAIRKAKAEAENAIVEGTAADEGTATDEGTG